MWDNSFQQCLQLLTGIATYSLQMEQLISPLFKPLIYSEPLSLTPIFGLLGNINVTDATCWKI